MITLTSLSLIDNKISYELQPGQRLTLIDDLLQAQHENVEITITIPKDAHLTYENRVVDTQRTHLAEKEISSNVSDDLTTQAKKIHFKFTGEGAHADVKCTYLSGSDKSFKLKTIQEHIAPRTTSSLEVKGVFEGSTKFFCDNIIQILEGAQQVDAFQCNKNLLLSPDARAISIPKMEVEAHDVSCQHGAATSRIGGDEMFYLQSRGMRAEQAKEMLIQAFLS